jgi:hypothetical protein
VDGSEGRGLRRRAEDSALDPFSELVPGAAVSTVFCAVIDPADGTLRYGSAGHPPAIVVDADGGSRLLEDATSLPLAVAADLERPEAEVVLMSGSTPSLYTDGLIERRGQVLDEGMARAAGVLRERRYLAPPALAELLIERLLADDPDDDVALLLYPLRRLTRTRGRGRGRRAREQVGRNRPAPRRPARNMQIDLSGRCASLAAGVGDDRSRRAGRRRLRGRHPALTSATTPQCRRGGCARDRACVRSPGRRRTGQGRPRRARDRA